MKLSFQVFGKESKTKLNNLWRGFKRTGIPYFIISLAIKSDAQALPFFNPLTALMISFSRIGPFRLLSILVLSFKRKLRFFTTFS